MNDQVKNPPENAVPQQSQVPDLTGSAVPVTISKVKECWSEFTLSDGSILKLKPALIDVKRLENQYGPDGNPIYIIANIIVSNVEATPSLKKKG